MKNDIIRKAFYLDLDRIYDGFQYSDRIIYADSINKAKSILLADIRYDDMKINNGDEITYFNIPVKRSYLNDEYDFEGRILKKYNIDHIMSERERLSILDKFLFDNIGKQFHILKGGWYYRKGSCGYTANKNEGGIYSVEDAISHAKHCSDLILKEVNYD